MGEDSVLRTFVRSISRACRSASICGAGAIPIPTTCPIIDRGCGSALRLLRRGRFLGGLLRRVRFLRYGRQLTEAADRPLECCDFRAEHRSDADEAGRELGPRYVRGGRRTASALLCRNDGNGPAEIRRPFEQLGLERRIREREAVVGSGRRQGASVREIDPEAREGDPKVINTGPALVAQADDALEFLAEDERECAAYLFEILGLDGGEIRARTDRDLYGPEEDGFERRRLRFGRADERARRALAAHAVELREGAEPAGLDVDLAFAGGAGGKRGDDDDQGKEAGKRS